MRRLRINENPEELTPDQKRLLTAIVSIVGVAFVILAIGLCCLVYAYNKCNCHAV